MLIRLFRSQYLIQYVLLFLLTVLLWADALLFPEKLVTGSGFENFPMIRNFSLGYPLIAVAASILILYLQALMLNSVVGEHRLVERNQLITGAIYVLLMSSQPEMVQPNVMLLVNFLLILLLHIILKLYGANESFSALFDAGFLAGLASLLYFPAISFMLFIVLSLMVFQLFRWREWVIPVLGFLAPYLLIATWYFWLGQLEEKLRLLISRFDFQVPDYPDISTETLTIWGLIALMILLGLGKILKLTAEGAVDSRRKSRVVFYMLLVAILSAFFAGQTITTRACLEVIPVVIFLGAYVSRLRKLFLAELLLSMLVIAIVAIKVLNFS